MSAALRDGTLADHPALIRLWQAAWQATRPDIDFAARLDFIAGRLQDAGQGRYHLRVTTGDAGKPTGFTLIEPEAALLEQIAVDPACWGQGIADTLLDDAEARFGTRLWLTVNQFNARAIRFYTQRGFDRAGEGISPAGLPTYVMRRKQV